MVIEEQLPHLDDVYTDTLLIMQDLIATIYNTQATISIIDEGYGIGMPVSCVPFTAQYDNLLTGWDCTINIRIPNALELCDAPVA